VPRLNNLSRSHVIHPLRTTYGDRHANRWPFFPRHIATLLKETVIRHESFFQEHRVSPVLLEMTQLAC
jgi:hypothetical protein